MFSVSYLLNQPGGAFVAMEKELPRLGPGEMLVRTRRVSVCQSDVVIQRVGLPRIKSWPAEILHEVSATVEAVGEGVMKFAPGDLVGIGCDIPCGDRACIYCGDEGTGDWTCCPNTQATGHEFPGFARTHAILPDWFVDLGPIMKFPGGFDPDHACQLEPLPGPPRMPVSPSPTSNAQSCNVEPSAASNETAAAPGLPAPIRTSIP